MKKLLLAASLLVSALAISQEKRKLCGIDADKFFYTDSVFFSKHKIDEQKLKVYILNEVNVQRKLNHLHALTMYTEIENKKAVAWCDTMISRGVQGHDNDYIRDQANNKTRGDIIISFLLTTNDFENSTNIYESISKSLVDRWMKSPGHRAAILKLDINSAAVGSSFGKPSAAAYGISGRSVVRFF
jgi:uncharacterized protein YkwD